MSTRTIWVRGLTPNEKGRLIELDKDADVQVSDTYLLKSVEHYDGRTVLSVVVTLEVPHDALVTIHE
ncbi:hypothetical protein Pan2_35 [Pseudanabaena phage Pan2]|nr:hypothetical protein Pan2_35 [Pseudanabaena phage Pan2]